MRSSLFIGLVSISLQKLSHRGTRGNHAGVLDCTACYQTLGQGNIFRSGRGGLPTGEGSASGAGGWVPLADPPGMRKVGGMHLTGMLSCFSLPNGCFPLHQLM